MRCVLRLLVAAVSLVLLPAPLWAQAAITGVVKDASGAVLPGVTVEAASPSLIERVRTVVSDSSGQYRIVDLRTGTYSLRFSLTGFNTVQREGIELSGTFVATVNADLKVGSLQRRSVTGETPIVDIQSAKVQTSSPRTSWRPFQLQGTPAASGVDSGMATTSDSGITGGTGGAEHATVARLTREP
jgi:hypothetical protein